MPKYPLSNIHSHEFAQHNTTKLSSNSSRLNHCKQKWTHLLHNRVSKFAVENVFNSNATIVVLNSTKMTAINDNEKNLAKNEEKLTSS